MQKKRGRPLDGTAAGGRLLSRRLLCSLCAPITRAAASACCPPSRASSCLLLRPPPPPLPPPPHRRPALLPAYPHLHQSSASMEKIKEMVTGE